MLPSLGPLEILVILVVVVLVFPPHKLPELARNLGRGLHELQKVQRSLRADLDELMDFNADSPADDGSTTTQRDGEGDDETDEPPVPPRPGPPALPGA
jgi:sec-independent protein translocase protein TatA